jgi:hypothetical protein
MTASENMGYFSNGTEGGDYQDRWCARCLHDNPDKHIFCPVWDAHLNHAYDGDYAAVLDMLIPRTKDGLDNERCTMFVDRGALSNLSIERFEHDAAALPEPPK